jgi:hypothetical protein
VLVLGTEVKLNVGMTRFERLKCPISMNGSDGEATASVDVDDTLKGGGHGGSAPIGQNSTLPKCRLLEVVMRKASLFMIIRSMQRVTCWMSGFDLWRYPVNLPANVIPLSCDGLAFQRPKVGAENILSGSYVGSLNGTIW